MVKTTLGNIVLEAQKIKINTFTESLRYERPYRLEPIIYNSKSMLTWKFIRCDRTWQFYDYLDSLFYQIFGAPANYMSNYSSKSRWDYQDCLYMFKTNDDLLLAKMAIDISELERLAPLY